MHCQTILLINSTCSFRFLDVIEIEHVKNRCIWQKWCRLSCQFVVFTHKCLEAAVTSDICRLAAYCGGAVPHSSEQGVRIAQQLF